MFGKKGFPYGELSPYDLYKAGYKDLGDKLFDRRAAYDKQSDRDRETRKNSVSSLMGWRGDLGQRSDAIKRSVDRGQFRTTDSSRERQLKELGDMMRAYADPNKQTSPYRFALSAREGLQRLDEVITPAARGTKVDSERFKNLSSMEKRLLGL